jgi:hypothetical protein
MVSMPAAHLFRKIKQAVHEERYLIGRHANERLRQRRIPAWQVISGVESGILLRERPDAKPNPVAEVEQRLPDGTPVKAVWAWIEAEGVAKLVTVHFFDE